MNEIKRNKKLVKKEIDLSSYCARFPVFNNSDRKSIKWLKYSIGITRLALALVLMSGRLTPPTAMQVFQWEKMFKTKPCSKRYY